MLQLVRVLGATAVLGITAMLGLLDAAIVLGVLVYGVIVAIAELFLVRVPERATAFVTASVLVDGVALALVVSATGGARSPLLFLVFLDVVAATLLVSYRTGLKLALWCALLLLLAHALVDAGVIEGTMHVNDRFAVVSACTFLVFALSAAAFSSVNERSLRHSRSQLSSMVELGAELERSRRTDDVMAALVRHACARLGFVRVAVLVHHDSRWTGIVDDGRVEAHVELPDQAAAVVWECWSSSSPLLVRSLDDGLLDAVLPDASNVLVAPVAADDERLGVVVAEWGGEGDARIPSSTVQALAQAAMHTALALRNASLLVEVERLATRDSLTGIANRRLFDESLARETARSQRLGAPLSLVVFDVDHFKQINDSFGHLTGDAVLRDVAEALVAGTKGFDIAARLGGDEFVLLLPGCRREDAVKVADRVRSEIIRRSNSTAVTISAGVATMPDNAVDGERLVSAADAALYDAKRRGRDRSHASERVPEGGVASPGAPRWGGASLARGA
ncbi:MAG: GGDEF domain-containing protein [Acidimicrobiia bacterium]